MDSRTGKALGRSSLAERKRLIEEEKRRKRDRKRILILILLLFLLLGGTAAVLLWPSDRGTALFSGPVPLSAPMDPGQPDGVTLGAIDVGAGDGRTPIDLQKMVNDAVSEKEFRVFIDTKVIVEPDGSFKPRIQNVEANHYACWVEIVDEDGGIVYESDVLEPGYKIESDRLAAPLGGGRHACEARFHVLRGTDRSSGEINSTSARIELIQREDGE